ncbi:unnamed protein product [Gongylonema pulchrum]|uniref:Neurotransmitter-gated ion-channel ligand-binding domain-containing protein n=1 Tax=Gongylonema pulchrum TaxID=637853 RepID=A0A3P7RGP3_9BILA|nr:unnamed protein product [Gongylonema pulchrum]
MQDFTLDFYLRQSWNDPRLAFRHHHYSIFGEDIESLTQTNAVVIDICRSAAKAFNSEKTIQVGVDYLQKLWKPDTFFPNEKKSFFHIATTHNSFLRIDPNGNVLTSQRSASLRI